MIATFALKDRVRALFIYNSLLVRICFAIFLCPSRFFLFLAAPHVLPLLIQHLRALFFIYHSPSLLLRMLHSVSMYFIFRVRKSAVLQLRAKSLFALVYRLRFINCSHSNVKFLIADRELFDARREVCTYIASERTSTIITSWKVQRRSQKRSSHNSAMRCIR